MCSDYDRQVKIHGPVYPRRIQAVSLVSLLMFPPLSAGDDHPVDQHLRAPSQSKAIPGSPGARSSPTSRLRHVASAAILHRRDARHDKFGLMFLSPDVSKITCRVQAWYLGAYRVWTFVFVRLGILFSSVREARYQPILPTRFLFSFSVRPLYSYQKRCSALVIPSLPSCSY